MTSGSIPRRLSLHLIAAAIVATAALGWQAGARAQSPAPVAATQSSSDRGVTVKVTPRPAARGSDDWAFDVVLDTHSADLDDDLLKTTVLLADGSEMRPRQWTGAAPGGHHRQGVLAFSAPNAPVNVVELRMQRAGEKAPRVFRWDAAVLR